MSDLPYKEILLLILGTLSTYLIWRVQYQKEKIKNIEINYLKVNSKFIRN